MRSSFIPVLLFSLFGVVPFLIWTLFAMTDTHLFGYSGIQLFASYGAIVLSFFNGLVFGQVLENQPRHYSRRLMTLANIIALIAWITLLIGVPVLSVAILLLGFISTFWLEGRWLKVLFDHSSSYSKIRFSLITVICVLHILVLFPQY